MFPISIGIPREELLCGTKEFDGVESGAWLAAKKRGENGEPWRNYRKRFMLFPATSLARRVNALGR